MQNKDIDERYRQAKSMKCPFKQGDDKCICYRCRTGKWPGLYVAWVLTESQAGLIESNEPNQRREWAENHVIGEHFFANSEHVENGGRSTCNERGGNPSTQSIEEVEGQDADQETARGQAVRLELSVSRDWQVEIGHRLGWRSGARLESSAQKQGHDSDDEPLGPFESKRDRRAAKLSKRKVAPSRAEGVDPDLAGGERGASGRAAILAATMEAEPIAGLAPIGEPLELGTM